MRYHSLLFVIEYQSPIELCNLDLEINTDQMNGVPRSIMAIVPGFGIVGVLFVALPDFNILRELTDQDDFLDGFLALIGFKLRATIFGFGARRKHFHHDTRRLYQGIVCSAIRYI